MRFPDKESNKDDRAPEHLDIDPEEVVSDEMFARREATSRLRHERIDLLQHRENLVNLISQHQVVHEKLKGEVDRKNNRISQIDVACASAQKFIQDSQRRSAELQDQLQRMKDQLARLKSEKETQQNKLPQKQEKKCMCDKCNKQSGECNHAK